MGASLVCWLWHLIGVIKSPRRGFAMWQQIEADFMSEKEQKL